MSMSKKIPHQRTTTSEDDVVWAITAKYEYRRTLHHRRYERSAKLFRAQYFALEQRLHESFRFVSPCSQNETTTSIEYADLLRGAANLFESCSRDLLNCLYTLKVAVNIKHYLALDDQVKFADKSVICGHLHDQLKNSEVNRPFLNASGRQPGNLADTCHIPGWWTAYNNVKHDPSNYAANATFANAIAAVAANFVMLHQIYGPGFVYNTAVDSTGVLLTDGASKIFSLYVPVT
jgi:hypothetical protein